jgi:Chaperone of endosialidase
MKTRVFTYLAAVVMLFASTGLAWAFTETDSNNFFGTGAGESFSGGDYNTYIGAYAGFSNSDGNGNTFLGAGAGYSSTGSGNVFIGYAAGADDQDSSNTLYIDNCYGGENFCNLPLIYGEFDNRLVAITGEGLANPTLAIGGASDNATTKPTLLFMRARGTHDAPTAIQNGDWLGQFSLNGYNGGPDGFEGARRVFQVEATENWTTTAGGYRLVFYTRNNGTVGAPTARLTVNHNGYVGVGTQSPAHLIQLSGGAYSDGATWVNASSREYKENIKELTTEEADKTLAGLNPVKYNYKTDKEDKHVGFIAEDVPDLVATRDRKGLSPMDIVAVLTKVVKGQQKTIEEQHAINEVLMKKLSKLEAEVNSLKSKDMTAQVVEQ